MKYCRNQITNFFNSHRLEFGSLLFLLSYVEADSEPGNVSENNDSWPVIRMADISGHNTKERGIWVTHGNGRNIAEYTHDPLHQILLS